MGRVGLALIAKNEERRLPLLLGSIDGAFDRVALVDTGSTDKTKQIFTEWADDQHERHGMSYAIGNYEWQWDFADARRNADFLLVYGGDPGSESLVDWTVWADCDDEIRGAQNIRTLCDSAAPEIAALMMDYDYARDPVSGACLSYLRRERAVRVGRGQWTGRVHEAQTIHNGVVYPVPPDQVLFVHHKPVEDSMAMRSTRRNLKILREWAKDEPDNPRVQSYLGVEYAIQGKHRTAIKHYRKYLSLPGEWMEERVQVMRRLAASHMALGEIAEAEAAVAPAFSILPDWPDTPLTMMEVSAHREQWDKVEMWARRVISIGIPDRTLLIINPLDYTYLPHTWLARSMAAQGKFSEALEIGQAALNYLPQDQQLRAEMMGWQSILKRERTADTFSMCAQQLIAHDEQLKALTLLNECVPHFATDHPKIVQIRSMLRERLAWIEDFDDFADHYETGGSKPEDFVPDADAVCDHLPRAHFLLEGIMEQVNEA